MHYTKEKEIEKIFKALANKRRLAILGFLKRKKELSVGEIASEIKLSFRSTSKHLQILIGAEMLECEQRDKMVFYKISPKLSAYVSGMLKIL